MVEEKFKKMAFAMQYGDEEEAAEALSELAGQGEKPSSERSMSPKEIENQKIRDRIAHRREQELIRGEEDEDYSEGDEIDSDEGLIHETSHFEYEPPLFDDDEVEPSIILNQVNLAPEQGGFKDIIDNPLLRSRVMARVDDRLARGEKNTWALYRKELQAEREEVEAQAARKAQRRIDEGHTEGIRDIAASRGQSPDDIQRGSE